MCVRMYVYMDEWVDGCMYICDIVRIYVCMYVYMYVLMYVYICMYEYNLVSLLFGAMLVLEDILGATI